ncbi:MAG: PQQ-like beta-propeller repeat protein [Pirellulaceae bacterium]|nr:PQQ-like beta-propeller repeat protein [Pirellulaceae bacterium]
MNQPFRLCVISLLLGVANCQAQHTDWRQWRGNHRDAHAAQQALLQQWPVGGPQIKWEFTQAGSGYSSVSVVDGKLYTLGARDGGCFAICIDMKTGKQLWDNQFAGAGVNDDYNQGWGGGPRSTPTVDGDQVFVLSDVGVLAALSVADGTIQWTTDFVADHGGKIPVWGYSESPLVDNDRIMVTPGGDDFMIGLDRKTGKKVWSSKGFNDGAQYVSIMRGSIGDRSYYVTATKAGLVAFDTQSGDKVFADSATANKVAVIPTPVIDGDLVYHTSAYGAGNTLLKLTADGDKVQAETVYALQGKSMENHHGGTVLVDGVIYGFTKANGGTWMAQEMSSGKTLWEEKIRPNRSGSICFADGRLYCYNDKDGSVYLVPPSREGWQSNGKLTLPKQTTIPREKGAIWAHPVVADQTLIIRDQDLIYAFDIAR